MGQKIVVGPIGKGLRNDVTPFNIDNDSFPTLINAYQWRGRLKRKRGTQFIGRLTRYFESTSTAYSSTATINLVAGAANILTGFSLQLNGNIIPGTVIIVDTTAGNTYTDPAMDGTLVGAPGGTGTINYATGDITIAGGAANAINATFLYYPDLPVMGLLELILLTRQYPGTIAFDTKYAYEISTSDPYPIHDVSFFKNVSVSTYYPGYVPKTTWTPVTWNGQDYQQFWGVNYQGALWVTNGVTQPFNSTNVGMQYQFNGTIVYVDPTTITIDYTTTTPIIGDFVFLNEITTNSLVDTTEKLDSINFQAGYVINVVGNTRTIRLPYANVIDPAQGDAGKVYSGGITQLLTNISDPTKDVIRWYDGDPTDGDPLTPGFSEGRGWVNFMPPLSRLNFNISDLPAAQYYLVGAKIILPFKDRLLFFGPVVQTSVAGSQVYLKDTVIYSQNGTPYYTSSFEGAPNLATTEFREILVPENQTATAPAFWADQTGFGGWVQSGIDEAINTVSANEDVLILGFDYTQQRFVYTGNDIVPFNFFTINSELGSSSTFSTVNLDEGVMTRGSRGFVITSQVGCKRFDLEIPDEVFQTKLLNNGAERFCSVRNFINEWVYFTYPTSDTSGLTYFPSQTLMYNYRDHSWAVHRETYTAYGQFRRQSGFTWSTVGDTFASWEKWTESWESGSSQLLEPIPLAGNQDGFILIRDVGTGEGESLYIRSFTGSQVNSPDHSLNSGDFIIISGAIGTISTEVNDKIFQVDVVTDRNNFTLNPLINTGTYFGGGVITRMYVPYIQSKQFPAAWDMGRKTRLGVQQYLLSTTPNGKIQLLIFLSQNDSDPYNDALLDPNDSLLYSTTLFTCPESTNLGLTPANINLNSVTAIQQSQIWHRINTSLLGDTIQVGFTMSEDQMRDVGLNNQFEEIEIHGFILDVSPSMLLA